MAGCGTWTSQAVLAVASAFRCWDENTDQKQLEEERVDFTFQRGGRSVQELGD